MPQKSGLKAPTDVRAKVAAARGSTKPRGTSTKKPSSKGTSGTPSSHKKPRSTKRNSQIHTPSSSSSSSSITRAGREKKKGKASNSRKRTGAKKPKRSGTPATRQEDEKTPGGKGSDKLVKQLKVGPDVRCLCVVGSHLWEASRDGAVHIRKFKDGSESRSIKAQTAAKGQDQKFFVNAMALQGEKVWLGDSLGNLRAYSRDGVSTLVDAAKGSQAGIKALSASDTCDGNILWSGGEDWQVTLYLSSNGMALKSLGPHKSWVQAVCVDNYHGRTWSSSEDGIRVWSRDLIAPALAARGGGAKGDSDDVKDSKHFLVKQMLKRDGIVSALCAVDHYVWSGGYDKQLIIWRASDLKLLAKNNTHKAPITGIKLVGREVFSYSSLSSEVCIWGIGDTFMPLRTITLPLKAKTIDLARMGRMIWIGARKPGALFKYKCTPSDAAKAYDSGHLSPLQQQQRAFARFINHKLSTSPVEKYHSMHVPEDNLAEAMSDGTKLCALLDTLELEAGRKPNQSHEVSEFIAEPKGREDQLANIGLCLKEMKKQRVGTAGVTAEDVADKQLQSSLDLLWELIRKYHIRLGYADNRTAEELGAWTNRQLAPYRAQGIGPVHGFEWSWYDGRALSGLVEWRLAQEQKASLINLDEIKSDAPLKTVQHALETATRELDIPVMSVAEDIVACPHDRALMTYVAFFRPSGLQSVDVGNSYVLGPAPEGMTEHTNDDVDWCKASLRGPDQEPLVFTVFAKDIDGEAVQDATCEVKLNGPDGDVTVHVEDNEDGTFYCSYETPLPQGTYTLDCLLDGQSVSNCPIEFGVKNGADTSKSYVDGPGVTDEGANNGERTFTVHALDKDGQPVEGAECKVEMTGPKGSIPVTVLANDDGTFDCEYGSDLPPGDYKVACSLDGEEVSNCPLTFHVRNGCDPDNSYAEGPGLSAAPLGGADLAKIKAKSRPSRLSSPKHGNKKPKKAAPQKGVEAGEFLVYALDSKNEPVLDAVCSVTMTGPAGPVPVHITDDDNGVFGCAYDTPLPPGDYEIMVKLDDTPVRDMPVTFTVKKRVDPDKCWAEGPGLLGGGEGAGDAPGTFVVHALDEDGQPVLDAKCTATLDGPSGPIAVSVSPKPDGTFDCHYDRPLAPGTYTLNIFMDGSPIKDCPITFTIKKAASASSCYADGPGLNPQNALDKALGNYDGDGSPTAFTVHAVDEDGVPVSGATCAVRMQGPDGDMDVKVKNNGDGTYNCDYADACGPDGQLAPGNYTILPSVNDALVSNAPVRFTVKPGADPATSFAEGPGLRANKIGAQRNFFDVFALDKTGQPVKMPLSALEVTVTDPSGNKVDVDVSPLYDELDPEADGADVHPTHHVMYHAKLPGLHTVTVKIAGEPIKDMPVKVMIKTGACAAMSSGLSFAFTIVAVDDKGAIKTQGGDRWEVAVADEEDEVMSKVRDHGDGTYSAEYKLSQEALYKVHATLNGGALSFSPFTHDMRAGVDFGREDDDGQTF